MSIPAPHSPAARGNANIARHLGLMAQAQPQRAALKIPRGRTRSGDIDYLTLTFAELDREVAVWSIRLTRAGVGRGDRTLVMVKQGLPLIASVFALFRIGAVPVVIDPGMGLKSFLVCVERSQPRALLGIPLAQVISRVFRGTFRSVRARVTASSRLTARLSAATSVRGSDAAPSLVNSASDELAAILFTSGSTGAPKGVCYEHGMFDAQVRSIQATYQIKPGEIDLPLLPIFALFNPALGMTTIVPEIDPRRPASFDPAKIVQAIRQEGVTNSFGSPTLWSKIGEHCAAGQITLPTVRRVLCAGAAVPTTLWQNSRKFLPQGRLHSPYGATECLPLASVSVDEIERQSVHGACVGRPVAGIDLKIIAIVDGPIPRLEATREQPCGEVGEIIVRGPVVTKIYDNMPGPTALAKIPDLPPATVSALAGSRLPDGTDGQDNTGVWHRMGDCGYLDANNRLWFCGRKVERVVTATETWHTEPCEQVFRQHPRARRCALIGMGEPGQQRPAMVVETSVRNSAEARTLVRELRELGIQYPYTKDIRRFYFRASFPVDVRHNAKIHRLTLAQWALSALGYDAESEV
jgi:acyl-CoA synthetase (AMP-forming)/AMP-acid ligase II